MFEQTLRAVDVTLVLAACELLPDNKLVTVWTSGAALHLSFPGRNAAQVIVIEEGKVTAETTTPSPVLCRATMPGDTLYKLLKPFTRSGESLRVSIDLGECCMAVTGLRPQGTNPGLQGLRVATLTKVENTQPA